MEEQITQLYTRIQLLERIVLDHFLSDRYAFSRDIEMQDGRNLKLSTATGTKIGTATGQKLGLFNATPVVQAAAIASPSGGGTIDTQARTAIDSIRTALINIGITA